MLALLIIILSIWFTIIVDSVAKQYAELAIKYESASRQKLTENMAAALKDYYKENKDFPDSLIHLQSSSGFEFTRSYQSVWDGYEVQRTLKDNLWTFDRMVYFSSDPAKGIVKSEYLNENKCGTGSFYIASSWCGDRSSWWYRLEKRESYIDEVVTQKKSLNVTLQKFAPFFNAKKRFPTDKNNGGKLNDGDIETLSSIVEYSGTYDTCNNIFDFEGVPIDCADLFDNWGNPIRYYFKANKHIVLLSDTNILNKNGQRVTIAVEYDFSRI